MNRIVLMLLMTLILKKIRDDGEKGKGSKKINRVQAIFSQEHQGHQDNPVHHK